VGPATVLYEDPHGLKTRGDGMSVEKSPVTKLQRPTFQVFDLVGKYIYQTASAVGTVNSLRGIYKRVNLAPEIALKLGRTEHIRNLAGLDRIIGDLVFEGTAADLLMEFQIKKDRKLGIRVFNYGSAHAQRNAKVTPDGARTRQALPKATVVYLGPPPFPPETLFVETTSETGCFVYEIPVYSVLAHTVEDMERDHQYLLMPFQLLRHRKKAASSKTSEEQRNDLIRETLETAVRIEAILEQGCQTGNITESDVTMLLEVMETLYNEVYECQEGAMNFAEQLKKKGIHLKFPEWQAEQARFEAEKAKIFSLWKQGYTPEEAEKLLAQEAAATDSPQPATI
jgi:hypothetical protein